MGVRQNTVIGAVTALVALTVLFVMLVGVVNHPALRPTFHSLTRSITASHPHKGSGSISDADPSSAPLTTTDTVKGYQDIRQRLNVTNDLPLAVATNLRLAKLERKLASYRAHLRAVVLSAPQQLQRQQRHTIPRAQRLAEGLDNAIEGEHRMMAASFGDIVNPAGLKDVIADVEKAFVRSKELKDAHRAKMRTNAPANASAAEAPGKSTPLWKLHRDGGRLIAPPSDYPLHRFERDPALGWFLQHGEVVRPEEGDVPHLPPPVADPAVLGQLYFPPLLPGFFNFTEPKRAKDSQVLRVLNNLANNNPYPYSNDTLIDSRHDVLRKDERSATAEEKDTEEEELAVSRFSSVSPPLHLNSIPRSTIFASVASYRDGECSGTILELFTKAAHPERVYVGVLEQHDRKLDRSCLPGRYFDEQHSRLSAHMLATYPVDSVPKAAATFDKTEFYNAQDLYLYCQRRKFCPTDNIRRRLVPPTEARGPVFGRFMTMLMYRGESYLFVMDSHNYFVPQWDLTLLHMYQNQQVLSRHGKIVFSHYPEAYHGPQFGVSQTENKVKGASTGQGLPHNPFTFQRETTAYLCRAHFLPTEGYLRLDANVVTSPMTPLPQPWAAAGFVFADAGLLAEVPFDPNLDFIFDGEEILYSTRMWTHGWDMFSPTHNIMFHSYTRAKAPKMWTPNSGAKFSEVLKTRSIWRIQYLLRTLKWTTHEPKIPDLILAQNGPRAKDRRDPDAFVDMPTEEEMRIITKETDIYGLGSARSLEEYFAYAGADPLNRTMTKDWLHVSTLTLEGQSLSPGQESD